MRTGIVSVLALAMVVGLSATAFAATAKSAEQKRGEEIYSEFCVTCHGKYGRGDGPLASDLTRKPPDFTDSKWLAGRSNSEIVKALEGAAHGSMATAGLLKPDALRDSIAYIRTLSVPGEHVSVAAGRDIYNTTCWPCHGMKGDGNGPVAKLLTGPKPRDFTSPTFVIVGREDAVAEFISLGAEKAAHGSKYMPEWASRLSPQQIRDTVAYLKTFKAANKAAKH